MIIDSNKIDRITPKGCHAFGRKLCHLFRHGERKSNRQHTAFGILSFTHNFLQSCHPFGIETA